MRPLATFIHSPHTQVLSVVIVCMILVPMLSVVLAAEFNENQMGEYDTIERLYIVVYVFMYAGMTVLLVTATTAMLTFWFVWFAVQSAYACECL